MELGVFTFGELDPRLSGDSVAVGQRMRDLVDEIVLADQVGLDVFGVGEHHRTDYIVSSPAIVLAAAASRTEHIRLTSAVSVLSSDDPVRVFQNFSTVDLISNGRAEIMAGRGSFIESFPLFGQDLADYNGLFAEKLELLLKIRGSERVTWSGHYRAPIDDRGVYPRPLQDPLPVWIAVGGTPQSVVRAATLGLPMAIAIIGGMPERFVPFADLYRETWAQVGHDPSKLRLAISSHGFLADSTEAAVELAFPPYIATMGRIGRERGWPMPTRQQFDFERAPRGALLLGSPDEVIEKILMEHELFHHDRMMIQFSVGPMKHADIMHSIELFGTRVAPAVRKALGGGSKES